MSMFSASIKTLTRTSATSEIDEPTICDLRILSETMPTVFLLSGDNQGTMVDLSVLDASLAGTLLLAECYGNYPQRCLIWLWRYLLRRHSSITLQITAEGPDNHRGGQLFTISG
ncbi:hypothetical protein LARI1_G009588, partial [Lachnellula arida]